MKHELKPGTLVLIMATHDTSREGEYGVIERPMHGPKDYPHDYFIRFLVSGERAPYGPHEFQVITRGMLEKQIFDLQELMKLIPEDRGGK